MYKKKPGKKWTLIKRKKVVSFRLRALAKEEMHDVCGSKTEGNKVSFYATVQRG